MLVMILVAQSVEYSAPDRRARARGSPGEILIAPAQDLKTIRKKVVQSVA